MHDDPPAMCRVAHLIALALLTPLFVLALVAVVAALGLVGLLVVACGASLVVPEIVVERRQR